MKRRLYKRSWQKFDEIQESFRENVRSSSEDSGNEDKEEARDACNQLSPELVLYESDSRFSNGETRIALSPEIIFKRPTANSGSQAEIHKDAIEDAIVRSISSSRESRRSNLFVCDLNIESTIRDENSTNSIHSCSLPYLKNAFNSDENETVDVTNDERFSLNASEETTRRRVAFPSSNLESRSSDDSVPGPANFYKEREGASSPRKNANRSKNDVDVPEITDDCYSLDKTFSINDNLIRDMNNYLEGQSSTTIVDPSTTETSAARLTISRESEKRSGIIDDVGRLSCDELNGSSICGSIEDYDRSPNDRKRRRETPVDKRFDITFERIGERLTTHFREFCKMFAYLQQIRKKIYDRTRSECGASSWKIFPYVSSVPRSSFSPICTRFLFAGEGTDGSAKDGEEAGKIESKIRLGTDPRGESPSMKRFENPSETFFDYKGEAKRQRRSEIQEEITDSFPGKDGERSLDPSLRGKTRWISKSTLDLSTAYNYDPLQKVEYHQDGTYKRQMLQNDTMLQDSHASRSRNICRALISWSYHKLQGVINPSSSTETPRTKKFNRLVETLRFENEKTLRLLSKKVTRLSTDFVQMRTSTEVTLKALTIEVNVIREASKKIIEDNMMLMQEMKKLRETLEEIRSKFLQPVPSFPLCPSSFSPLCSTPPPPAPLSISLLSKANASESASAIPPPPPFPLASLQSPKLSIQSSKLPIQSPTTPNSSRSNKRRKTPRKCSTPLFSRPSITVEDLLKVTLKKAPQSIKDNRRNTVPGPRGPVVSLEMLRNVKLKSAKRKPYDQTGKSPRSGRIVKNRAASNVNLSPILTGSEGNLERILRQVNVTRPRRLISGSNNFRDRDFVKEMQSQSLQTLMCNQSQSALE